MTCFKEEKCWMKVTDDDVCKLGCKLRNLDDDDDNEWEFG
jgi:hypothetical protein